MKVFIFLFLLSPFMSFADEGYDDYLADMIKAEIPYIINDEVQSIMISDVSNLFGKLSNGLYKLTGLNPVRKAEIYTNNGLYLNCAAFETHGRLQLIDCSFSKINSRLLIE